MNKILIIGNYGYHTNNLNGQTIRTRTVANSISSHAKGYKIINIDTSYKTIHLFIKALINAFIAKKIVIMIGKNGLSAILTFLEKTGLGSKTIYVVIGGWLAEYLEYNKVIIKRLQKIKAIHVQTKKLKLKLNAIGLTNVYLLPNYRTQNTNIKHLSNGRIKNNRVVYYSRVCEEKGVELAIEAVKRYNSENIQPIEFDIYGPIQKSYESRFQKILRGNSHIKYYGVLEGENILWTLVGYSYMLFPTHYEGEGFPGAILEALIAGIPIIASDWKYNSEIIEDGFTGLIFDTFSVDDLLKKINQLEGNKDDIITMSENCLEESKKYEESKLIPILLKSLDLEY